MSKTSANTNAVIQVSAPGSIMLLGEHAVLRGAPAVVCAVNRRITVSLTPRSDGVFRIDSDRLGLYETCDITKIQSPWEFVLNALQVYAAHLSTGCTVQIRSDFSEKIGLGSSAAVTVAVLAALMVWQEGSLDLFGVYQNVVQVIRQVQGMGSGADVAASVWGGILAYQMDQPPLQQFMDFPPLTLIYAGYKTKTAVVVKRVNTAEAANLSRYREIFQKIKHCVQQGRAALSTADWKQLGQVFVAHHALQQSLGVSDMILDALVTLSQAQPNVWGAKISGSGLGDCVVVLGKLPDALFPMNSSQQKQGVCQIPIDIAQEGVRIEST